MKKFQRADFQVFTLTSLIIILTSIGIFLVGYFVSYHDMIKSLQDRVESIYVYCENKLSATSFENINSREDMNNPIYIEMKELFTNVKDVTNVRYLYTAKKTAEGKLIYVIDGLSIESEDFRYPGDLIEPEIIPDLEKALMGQKILPNSIRNTDWGYIFISYLPIHDQNNRVVGVIGIEFEAGHQYKTYSTLRIILPFIIVIACLISAICAVYFFKRISNPRFKDLANTDYLTGLKSRNAYETYIHNRLVKKSNDTIGIVCLDLNGLKKINDIKGHEMGDLYLKNLAEAIQKFNSKDQIAYRIGGDEFLILLNSPDVERIEKYLENLAEEFTSISKDHFEEASFAAGYAICSENSSEAYETAYREADQKMYQNKESRKMNDSHSK